jgi:hypothetical protein
MCQSLRLVRRSLHNFLLHHFGVGGLDLGAGSIGSWGWGSGSGFGGLLDWSWSCC